MLTTVLKLAGSLVLAFAGYFLLAAVGWPEPLESMVMERRFVGGAIILLGLLCAVASLMSRRRRKAGPGPAKLSAEPIDPPPVIEPEPAVVAEPAAEVAPAAAAEPFVEAAPVAEAPASEPAPEPAPVVVPIPAVTAAAGASLSAARALLAKGDALFGQGAVKDSAEPYGQALDMARALHNRVPADDTEDLLACALKAVADADDETGRVDDAIGHYEEALRLRMARLEAAPDDAGRKRAVSLVLERLGDAHDARGRATRALDLYRQSLPLAESLAVDHPDNAVYQEDLATTRKRLSELEAQTSPA